MGFKMVAVKMAVVSPVSWSILGLKREPFVVFWVERKIFSGQSNSPHLYISYCAPFSRKVSANDRDRFCPLFFSRGFLLLTDVKFDEICTVRNAIIIYKKYLLLKIFF